MDIESKTSMSVAGLDDLAKAFSKVESWVESDIMKKACKASAQIIADEAKQLAPRKTGKLSSKIGVRAGKSGPGRYSFFATVGKGWGVGDEFYGAFQEFGWKSGKRSGGKGQKARPENPGEHYMQYAIETKGSEALSQFVAVARARLEAEVK